MRSAECGVRSAEWAEGGGGPILVTRRGLAVALGVSLRTVERMLHDEEIKPVRVRGAQRFHVPEVVQELLASGATRKNGRKAVVEREAAATQYPRRVE